jgi:hypothetical protein
MTRVDAQRPEAFASTWARRELSARNARIRRALALALEADTQLRDPQCEDREAEP